MNEQVVKLQQNSHKNNSNNNTNIKFKSNSIRHSNKHYFTKNEVKPDSDDEVYSQIRRKNTFLIHNKAINAGNGIVDRVESEDSENEERRSDVDMTTDKIKFNRLNIIEIEKRLNELFSGNRNQFRDLRMSQIQEILTNSVNNEEIIGEFTLTELKQKLIVINVFDKNENLLNLPLFELINRFPSLRGKLPRKTRLNAHVSRRNDNNSIRKHNRSAPVLDLSKRMKDVNLNRHNETLNNNSNICKICLDKEIDCVLLECGHLVSCTKCVKQFTNCPLCRKIIIRYVKIYRS